MTLFSSMWCMGTYICLYSRSHILWKLIRSYFKVSREVFLIPLILIFFIIILSINVQRELPGKRFKSRQRKDPCNWTSQSNTAAQTKARKWEICSFYQLIREKHYGIPYTKNRFSHKILFSRLIFYMQRIVENWKSC